MFADEIRRAIDAADRIALPAMTALLWRAYGEGKVTDTEAEALSGVIEARTAAPALRRMPAALRSPTATGEAATGSDAAQDCPRSPRRPSVGSRPRTDASLERRRRWAASGRLPPGIASRFTLAEQAVLALVAAETARRGDCRLAHEHVAALCGVSRSTVKNAMREARRLGLITVEERPVTGFRNLPNIVRIVSREWLAWMRLARKHPSLTQGGGVNSSTRTPTQVPRSGKTSLTDTEEGCRQAAGDLDHRGPSQIRAGGGAGRAMR